MENCDIRKSIDEFEAWLQAYAPGNVVMPLYKGTKHPMARHKASEESNGVSPWTWDSWAAKRRSLDASGKAWDMAVLSRTLFVIDADSQDAVEYLLTTYPELRDSCSATTRKGMHFYFLRTQQCDDLHIFDRVRAMRRGTDSGEHRAGEPLAIDIKTVCSNGTGAIIACAPSTGKAWRHAPWDVPPVPLPEDLAVEIASTTPRGAAAVTPRTLGTQVSGTTPKLGGLHKWLLRLLQTSGFEAVDVRGVQSSGFNFRCSGECRCCGNVHESNCSYAIYTGLSLYVKSYSKRCRPVILPVPAFAPFLDWENHVDEALWPGGVIGVDQRFLTDLNLDSSTIACFSGCGSGKSRALVRAMHNAAERLGKPAADLRILLVSTRVAFADSRAADLAHLGFHHYKTTSVELPDCGKLVCEMESLYKLRYGLPDYDMLWLDEGESIAANLSNQTTMERTICDCQWILEELFRTSRWILWMDAVPTVRGLTCLQELMRLTGRVGHIVNNAFKAQQGRRMHEVAGRGGLGGPLDAEAGERRAGGGGDGLESRSGPIGDQAGRSRARHSVVVPLLPLQGIRGGDEHTEGRQQPLVDGASGHLHRHGAERDRLRRRQFRLRDGVLGARGTGPPRGTCSRCTCACATSGRATSTTTSRATAAVTVRPF